MFVTPVTCCAHRRGPAVHPLAGFLGFAALPVGFFLILLGMIATYLLPVEVAKRRFYASRPTPTGRDQPTWNATSGASNGAPPASPTTPPMTTWSTTSTGARLLEPPRPATASTSTAPATLRTHHPVTARSSPIGDHALTGRVLLLPPVYQQPSRRPAPVLTRQAPGRASPSWALREATTG
jgi:hypothetical protein